MEHQLRLADRQGVLQGRDINDVQSQALEILMLLDDVSDFKKFNEKEVRDLKLALLSRPEYDPAKMFPDNTGESSNDADGDDVEYDYSAVEWKSPKDMDEEERDKLMAMVQRGAARMDFGHLEQGSGGWV